MKYLVLFLLLARAQVPAYGQEKPAFVLEAEDGPVRVYVRPEANDDMSIRVTARAQATVAAVVAVLNDVTGYPDWVHRCERAYVLPGGTADAFTYYSLVNLPFPFSDREVVAAIEQATDPRTGRFQRTISSRPDAVPRSKKAERIEVYEAVWEVAPAERGWVSVSCTVRTAAGAGLPTWLRKEIMTGGPAKTVNNLLRTVAEAAGQ